MELDAFYADAWPLLEKLESFVREHGLEDAAAADHICYKCGSRESFERIRALLEPEAHYVYQSFISGRRIAIVKLKRCFTTALGDACVLELSDQKPDGSQHDGFDHVEVCPAEYDEFVNLLKNKELEVREVVRPHHTTHDVALGEFVFRLTREPLLEKIKREEM